MEFFDALSRCWWLGKECVPEWDAWAAGAGFAAVVATVILGVVTYRLGRVANSATSLATEIALHQVKREDFRSETEELLVLIQITGEVSTNRQRISDLLGELHGGGVGEAHFVLDESTRRNVFTQIERIRFPLTAAVTDRLHFLDRKIAACLLRATSIIALVQDGCASASPDDTREEHKDAHNALLKVLPMVVADLEVVRVACEQSVNRLGIANPDFARDGMAMADMGE